MITVLVWPVALAAAFVWLAVALLCRYSSLAALVAVAAAAALAALVADKRLAAVAIGIAVLVVLRHHGNIRRLIAGSESRISFKKG